MIIFYEGLPRSGKSLSALKDYVVPMLSKGRKVFAYIEGLNHDHIALLADITPERCRELLIQLTREQVPAIYDHVENNSFVVIDELQNFWPQSREKLSPQITQFITEHGHRGLDILTMGQDLKDCHSLWKRRMAQKVFFLKREAAGKPNEFTAIVYKPVPKGRDVVWEELRSIKAQPYDEAYFGAYASHTADTDNKETLIDDRANVWNHPFFKKWLPIYGTIFVGAILYLVYLFKGGGLAPEPEKPKTEPVPVTAPQTAPVLTSPSVQTPLQANNHAPQKIDFLGSGQQQSKSFQTIDDGIIPDSPPDLIDHLSKTSRIRLGGYIQMGNKVSGFIEWRNESQGLVERMTFDDLQNLGWNVFINQSATSAFVQHYNKRYIATAWPLQDQMGKVSQAHQDVIRNAD